MARSGHAALNAAVLVTLLIGSVLPFDEGRDVALWQGPGVPGAAVVRVVLLALVVALVIGAFSTNAIGPGVAQLVLSLVLLAAVISTAEKTEPASGSGAMLLLLTAIVAALVGACATGLEITARRSMNNSRVDPSVNT